jgi:glycosyltransferase involved in cell wall biosynthesis
MKILLLAPQPFYTQRGTPIAVRNLATVLGNAGHDIDLLTYPDGDDIDINNTKILRCWKIPLLGEAPVGFSIKKLLYDMEMFFATLWLVLAHRYDVIHAVEESVYIGLVCAPIKQSQLIYDMDSSMADQLLEKWSWLSSIKSSLDWFEGLSVRHSTRVIAVCQALVDKAEAYRPGSPVELLTDTVLEVTPGIEKAEDLRLLLPGNHRMMLYIGNLEHYQGVDLVIEAMPKIDQDIVFIVIGGIAEDIARCKMLASQLGIEDRVMLLGPRPVELLQEYLGQADLLISPRTKGVNTPMKIYSYLGSGIPVIATDIPSHTQVLNGSNACLVDTTADSIAQGVNRIVNDPDYAAQVAGQAVKDADKKYSFDAYRKQLVTIYQALEKST